MIRQLTRFALVVGLLGMAASAYGQGAGLTVGAVGPAAKPRFYGFALDFTVADGSGLNSVGQNYRNDLQFYFEPTWNFGRLYLANTPFKNGALAGRFIVTQNLAGVDESNYSGNLNIPGPQGTCGDPKITDGVLDPTSVAYCNPPGANRRTDYSDLWFTLRFPRIYVIPVVDVAINPSLRFVAPTSAQSRFQTMAGSLTAFVGLARSTWKGRLRFGYSFGFNKFFHEQQTTRVSVQSPANGGTLGGNPYDGTLGAGTSNFFLDPTRAGPLGGSNTNFTVMNILSAGAQLHPKVSFDLLYFTVHSFAYGQGCTITIDGVPENICENGDAVAANSGSQLNRPGLRESQVLWAAVNYNPLDWLTLSLSWINFAPMFNLNSTYRQGIISTSYDAYTTLQLGVTVSTDVFAAKFIKEKQN